MPVSIGGKFDQDVVGLARRDMQMAGGGLVEGHGGAFEIVCRQVEVRHPKADRDAAWGRQVRRHVPLREEVWQVVSRCEQKPVRPCKDGQDAVG